MNSWIFYFTDSLRTMTAVTGVGTSRSEGEADALAKWEALASGRPDHGDRSPIVEVVYSGLSTEHGDSDMPGLIL